MEVDVSLGDDKSETPESLTLCNKGSGHLDVGWAGLEAKLSGDVLKLEMKMGNCKNNQKGGDDSKEKDSKGDNCKPNVKSLISKFQKESTEHEKKSVTFAENDHQVYSFEADDEDKTQKNGHKPATSLNIAAKKRAKDEDQFVGSLLTISPGEELEFCQVEESKETLEILSLQSNSDKHVAFKVKTTSPEKYRVRPSTGVVKPGSSAEVHVYLHPGYLAAVAKDKFLVMYMSVDPETHTSQVNDLFKTSPRDLYIEHRLRCKAGKAKSDEIKPEAGRTSTGETARLVQQVEQLVLSQQRIESRLGKMMVLQTFLLILLTLVCIVMATFYYYDVMPINKYTVNTCAPYHMS